MATAAAKSWRPAVVLMVATVFACVAPRAAAAEMAPSPSPSPSPDSGAADDPSRRLDEETDLLFRLLDQGIDLHLAEGELVEFQKYMDQLEASMGAGFRFRTTVWDLSPRELGFKLGVVFAQVALDCTVTARVSGSSTRPSPKIPFFITERLRLSGVTTAPRPFALPPSRHGL